MAHGLNFYVKFNFIQLWLKCTFVIKKHLQDTVYPNFALLKVQRQHCNFIA